jgi:hypothetical protein
MNITPEQAAHALREIENSRLAMRKAVQAHRGHLYLWLWGAIWAVMAVLNWSNPERYAWATLWLNVAGAFASFAIGFLQGRQIRSPIDKRFVGVCATILAFGYFVYPALHGGYHSYREAYACGMLIWMQLYIVGGLWFDNYWLWIGIAVTALILVGFLFLPAFFWGFALLGAFTLLGSGFYVRYSWR